MSNDRVAEAMAAVDRAQFVNESMRPYAGNDTPLPIGHGQTNSQPTTVRMMLEWLDVQPGDKVLDVGSGSGWTTALLATLVGENGQVFGVEIIPELLQFGKDNCQRAGIANATFYPAGDSFGLPRFAPYNRILVSAETSEVPPELLKQLEPSGKIVIPIKGNVLEITKRTDKDWNTETHHGFMFVPLVRKAD